MGIGVSLSINQFRGTGAAGDPYTLSGSLQAQNALLSAAGNISQDTTAGLVAQAALIAAAGNISQSVAAALQAQAATLAGQLFRLDSDIPAVIYNGATDYIRHTGGPAGASAAASTGTFVWCGTLQSDGSEMALVSIGTGDDSVTLKRLSDNTLYFEGVSSTNNQIFEVTTSAVTASLGLVMILASFNDTTAHLYVLSASGLIAGSNTPGTSGTLSYASNWTLGAATFLATYLDAYTALWWADDGYIDFSVAANREEFWDTTNDLPRDPGSDGSNPSGAQPLVCHKNPSASHTTNAGSGGDTDAGSVSGDDTSPGTWASDYTPSTFAVPLSVTESFEDEPASTNCVADMPATVNSGDLLIALVCSHRATPTGWAGTSGWTLLTSGQSDSGGDGNDTAVFAKAADGTEGGTTVGFTNNAGGPQSWSAQVYRIQAGTWHGTVSGGCEAGMTEFPSSANPDSPSLTPSWGSAKTLWIAGIGYVDDNSAVSAYPSSYTNGTRTTSDANSDNINASVLASARRELEASSEDPGAFTIAASEQAVAVTIAVRPAA